MERRIACALVAYKISFSLALVESMLEKISAAPADPILGLNDEFNADPRTNKINLGIGVYKDANGNTPVLNVVKKAETTLLAKEQSKSYLGISGTADYALAVQKLLFGENARLIADKRAQTAQAPGGTGGLRLAAELIKRQLGDVTVWVSDPTWANHMGIFGAAGLDIARYNYYDAEAHNIDFDAAIADLAKAFTVAATILPVSIQTWVNGRFLRNCVLKRGCYRCLILLIRVSRVDWKKTPRDYACLLITVMKSL